MPDGLSVLTLARGRRTHLRRLVQGLCRSSAVPDELIIVDMGGPAIEAADSLFPIKILSLNDDHLPLARARNVAAAEALHECLLFLDVDCIPMAGLLGAMRRVIEKQDALVCAEIHYLEQHALLDDWDEASMLPKSKTHAIRAFPVAGTRMETNPGLFWSLAFAVRRSRFNDLGRFDERFTGYGAEDTDFGFRADKAGVELLFLGGAGAFHQYHETFDPPMQHFEDIVRNAEMFHEIWGFWPMRGWLQSFERLGLVSLRDQKIFITRLPTKIEIEMARVD